MESGGEAADGDLPDEIFGALRLKRSTKAMTGYIGVYKSAGKKKPFTAQVKNKRTLRYQNLGTFQTAHAAAVAVAAAMSQGNDEDMDSPRKQAGRGTLLPWHVMKESGP